ncbi:MAG: NERD domain-containing protein [Verrucomicrobia bacterium]|nr:NERD domain-containing protein [Verrucomicrobiota bacterium]
MPPKPPHRRHARVQGSPGAGPRAKGLFRTLWPIFLFCIIAGYLVRAAWPKPLFSPQIAGFLLLILAGGMAYVMVWGEKRFSYFAKGARGEEEVARILSFLPASYRVFHGVGPAAGILKAGRDYDHIVVGPTGLFLVETKNWSGRITIESGEVLYNGQRPHRPAIDDVSKSARQLERELADVSVVLRQVHPVICFVSGILDTGRAGTRGVIICDSQRLLDTIRGQAETPLASRDIETIAAFLAERAGVHSDG